MNADRVAGHPHGLIVDEPSATAARTASRSRWAYAGDLLGAEGALDPGQRRRRPWRAEAGDLLFGNIDTWCIWNLTGGTDGGIHITDVSNASRTMLMDLRKLAGRGHRLDDRRPDDAAGDPRFQRRLRRGPPGGALNGVKIAGDLGDQQAATFGQTCFDVGEAKNTYGTATSCCSTPAPRPSRRRTACSRRWATRSATRTRSTAWRARDRDHRRAGAVAARQPEDDQGRAGGRGPGQVGRGQRRLLHRPGVQRPVRAVLKSNARGVVAG